MGGRKYIIVTILVWLLIGSWGLYLAIEGRRIATAEEEHYADLIARGAVIFAENCVICHGPIGEGVVGPPLNREAFRGDPAEDRDTFDLIYNTVANGRPGTTNPRWELLHTGEWVSYTAMPTFGVEQGGPLNEQALRAVTAFIMAGDWSRVSIHIPPANIPADREELLAGMPDAGTLDAEANRRGKEIFVDRGCITCHTVGSVGGNTGPDLSNVGQWVQLDREYWADFLWDWIANPPSVENRAPTYWSNYSGPLPFAQPATAVRDLQEGPGAPGDRPRGRGTSRRVPAGVALAAPMELPQPLPLELPTQMPAMPMTDEERDALVEYLLGLGS